MSFLCCPPRWPARALFPFINTTNFWPSLAWDTAVCLALFSAASFSAAQPAGVPFTLVPLTLVPLATPASISALDSTPAKTALPTASAAGDATQSPCVIFVAHLPNLRRELCEAAGLKPSEARSVKGQTLWTRDIAPAQPNLRVLVVGAIHGDELSSAAVVFHWIKLAEQMPADSPQTIAWRFIPVLNPDGATVQPPRRVNANGVDLNRNFPTPNWERDAKIYWEKRTSKDPRRWPGSKPLSEPESQFLYQHMQSFEPQLIVSIHAPYGVLDFDGPSVPPSKLGRLHLDRVGIFPGSLGNYGGVHQGVPVVTIELPDAKRTPPDAEIRQIWLDLLRWISERVMSDTASQAAQNPITPTP